MEENIGLVQASEEHFEIPENNNCLSGKIGVLKLLCFGLCKFDK